MIEKNKASLQEAINRLPSYEPPLAVWEGIDKQLGEIQQRSLLKQLPIYPPPAKVWNQINKGLEKAASSAQRQPLKAPSSSTWLLWVARVAAAVFLFSAGYVFANWKNQPKVSFAVRQEQSPPQGAVVADWNEEEERFQNIMDQLNNLNDPKLNALRTELIELTKAKQEVEEMLRQYGRDNRVIRQLVEIETQRSQLYRLAINEL